MLLAIPVQFHGEGTARGVLASSSADAVLRRRPMATGVRQICEVLSVGVSAVSVSIIHQASLSPSSPPARRWVAM